MRCILLILDGLGDKGHPQFKGRTPLQIANTPNLDYIAHLGINGLYHSYLQGVAMPSELAHFLIFGYDLHEFPGRGIFEAIGENIPVQDNDVALLARIFSVKAKGNVLILKKENQKVEESTCKILQKEIRNYQKDGLTIEFIPTKGVGGILVLRGEVSADITDSNPIYDGRPLMEIIPTEKADDRDKAVHTANVLNSYLRWCYNKLSKHPINKERQKNGFLPINAVGTQRAGQKKVLPSFKEKWGLKALSIASGSVYHGLCSVIGMELHKVRDTENVEKDLRERLKIAKEANGFDFIHVHTKAPDAAAHTKDPGYKKSVIESIDKAMSYVIEEIIPNKDILFVVTADHSTASVGKMIHSGETVPITILGSYTRRDEVKEFNEISCARGGLNLVRGKELMYLVLNYLDRGKLYGLMDTPVNQPYFPGNFKSLKINNEQ